MKPNFVLDLQSGEPLRRGTTASIQDGPGGLAALPVIRDPYKVNGLQQQVRRCSKGAVTRQTSTDLATCPQGSSI
jgi:hypothetical protein